MFKIVQFVSEILTFDAWGPVDCEMDFLSLQLLRPFLCGISRFWRWNEHLGPFFFLCTLRNP